MDSYWLSFLNNLPDCHSKEESTSVLSRTPGQGKHDSLHTDQCHRESRSLSSRAVPSTLLSFFSTQKNSSFSFSFGKRGFPGSWEWGERVRGGVGGEACTEQMGRGWGKWGGINTSHWTIHRWQYKNNPDPKIPILQNSVCNSYLTPTKSPVYQLYRSSWIFNFNFATLAAF